jgi:acyl-coenzyme A synthetase/AMP-(fatty) acid ligase
LSVLNSHLITGAETVVTPEPILSAAFWDAFRRYECTSWAGVPYSYQVLRRLDLRNLKLRSLRHLTQAGGKLSSDLIAHFQQIAVTLGASLWVMYGQTEATARISILPAKDLPAKLGSVGFAIPGGTLWTENGEIFYRGANVMMGYATSPEDLAAGDQLDGVLATGDLGYLDEEGYCYVTGRLKRIAKLLGVRINLDEIEQMVRTRVPAAVVGSDDRLVIFAEQNDEALFQSLRRDLAERLRVNHTCFTFRYIAALPVNANGKVDYRRLQEEL